MWFIHRLGLCSVFTQQVFFVFFNIFVLNVTSKFVLRMKTVVMAAGQICTRHSMVEHSLSSRRLFLDSSNNSATHTGCIHFKTTWMKGLTSGKPSLQKPVTQQFGWLRRDRRQSFSRFPSPVLGHWERIANNKPWPNDGSHNSWKHLEEKCFVAVMLSTQYAFFITSPPNHRALFPAVLTFSGISPPASGLGLGHLLSDQLWPGPWTPCQLCLGFCSSVNPLLIEPLLSQVPDKVLWNPWLQFMCPSLDCTFCGMRLIQRAIISVKQVQLKLSWTGVIVYKFKMYLSCLEVKYKHVLQPMQMAGLLKRLTF